MAFKGAVIAHIGAVPHVEAIRSLQSGGVLDRAAAFLLAPDPVSLLISDWFDLLLR